MKSNKRISKPVLPGFAIINDPSLQNNKEIIIRRKISQYISFPHAIQDNSILIMLYANANAA